MKKYFLKDKSLINVDDDQFRYQDFANNLRKIIEYNEVPFNIAIVGKWGLGKSSLINMALAPLRKGEKKGEFLICDINAWKYEKDEIGKAFLKELWEGISERKVLSFHFFHKEYSDIIEGMFKKDRDNPRKNVGLKNFGNYLIITLLVSIVIFAIYCMVSNNFYGIEFEKWRFVESTFLRYCKNIGSILIIPIVVWLGKLFMDKLNEPSFKKYEISFPLVTQADYEYYLKNLLRDYYKANPEKKIIVVIDDLDRLSADKIVEALDALKLFMEYDRFIFIVPFDDEILKNALRRKRINEIGVLGNEYEGEMVLDKIFQYKMFLPQLIKYDMRNYALEICKIDCIDFVREYCNDDYKLFEEIVGKILVHSNVSTPRQVKKIINTFIGNLMVARDREQAKKVGEKFATEKAGIQTIAKISVLQSDYNEFYDLLFIDSNVIKEILDIHRANGKKEPTELLRNYFDTNNTLLRKYEPLVNYLTFTENLGHGNITPYLYMAQTKEGVVVGDKKQQDFMAAIESCNFVSVKTLINETSILISLFIEQLKYNESPLMGNIILSAIDCFDVIPNNDKEELAVAIVERIPELSNASGDFRYYLLNEQNLIEVCHIANCNEHNSLVQYAIDKNLQDNNYNNKITLINKISQIRNELSDETLKRFVNYTREWMLSDEVGVRDIMDLTDNQGVSYIADFYGEEYVQKVARHITENDDFEDSLVKQFGSIISKYLKNGSILEIIDALEPCYEYPILFKVLDESISESEYKEIRDARNIALKIVSAGRSNMKGMHGYRILSKIFYTVTDAEGKEFDIFFAETLSEEQFAGMIEAFAKKNSLEILPQTVNRLSVYVFEEKGYAPDIKRLLKLYSTEQKEDFWKKLKGSCQYTSSAEYEILREVITELSKDEQYEKEIVNVIENIIIKEGRYYNEQNYLLFVIQIVSGCKDKISQSSIDDYTSALIKVLPSNTDNVINAYRVVSKLVSEDVWCKNMHIMLDYVTKGTYAVIYDITVNRIELFNEQNRNLEKLVEFLVDNISFSDNPDEVINILSAHFKTISNIENLIHILMDIEYDEDNASIKLAKFIDASNIDTIIKVIIDKWSIDDVHKEKLVKLLSNSEEYSSLEMPHRLNENKDNMSKNNILLMLEFCEGSITEANVESYIAVQTYLLENYLEKDVCTQILLRIGNLSAKAIAKQRESICKLLVDIFRKSSSEENRRKSSIVIKDKGFGKKVKNIFDENELKEYRAYLS